MLKEKTIEKSRGVSRLCKQYCCTTIDKFADLTNEIDLRRAKAGGASVAVQDAAGRAAEPTASAFRDGAWTLWWPRLLKNHTAHW
jgi:hypothetical protein